MPIQKPDRLAAPLKRFDIPIVSWHPNSKEFRDFQQKSRVTYTLPQPITINDREFFRIAAYDVNDYLLGEFILPIQYYKLWRRLIYGALFQEKMLKAWIERTKRLKKKKLNAVEEEETTLKRVAGVRLVQYLLCRRLVLEELMEIRFDSNPNPVIHSLIEFGIRDSRDWLFEPFENINLKKEGKYLSMDPTSHKNQKLFGES